MGDSTIITLEGVNSRKLNNISQRTNFYIDELDQLQERLAREARDIEDVSELLAGNMQRWQLTLDVKPEAEILETRLLRMERTIHRLDSVSSILQGDLGIILEEQDRLSDKRNELDQLLVRVRDQKTELGEQLFSKEMPGFFKDLSSLNDSTLVSRHISQLKKSISTDYDILKSEYSNTLIVVSILILVFIVLAAWYKRHFAKVVAVENFDLSEMHMTLIYSPVVTVIFVAALLIRFILSDLPHSFRSLNLVIMMVPMMIIVIRLFGSQIRTWILMLITVYSLTFLYELAYYPDILLRIILLIFSLAGLWLFIWIIIKKPLAARFNNNVIYRFFRILLQFFAVLLFFSLVANLIGAFSLAEFFTLLPIQITVLAIGIQVTTKVADTIVFLLLASNYMQKLNVIREEIDIIHRKVVWLIDLSLWIFFFSTTLRIFRVKDAVFEWGRGVLTDGWTIGAVDITPGSILIFFFVIWLSVIITRIVKHILEKDVFARISTSKGMPSTIIMLVRIALITGGFFLAAAAAGMKLTNLSIVLGAFSVGIGFGLQNIFNNMVSGLILAFERPIKVGDIIQVGELIGTVRSIDLRSSTVKSFDGAEVIIPNGNLISNEMINWTLSDSNRRMDIRVGVAYGTDPEVVIEIMEEIATAHEEVRKKPFPKAYFLGFGDSSLDFRLLAWANLDYRLETESEIKVTINKKLGEAGIEIPFPQRDLHLRSDATKVNPTASKTKPVASKTKRKP